VLLISVAACSGRGDPVSPPAPGDLTDQVRTMDSSNRVLFGAWIMNVSEDLSTVTPVPLRSSEGHLNIRTFLENGPCTNCLQIVGVTPQGPGKLDVDVRISHPFPGVDQFTGFDVRGTVIFNQTSLWPASDLSWSSAEEGGGELLNPDGWTNLFNPVDFVQGIDDPTFLTYQQGKFAKNLDSPSQLNAFKAFYIEPDRRPFFTSDAITKTYSLQLPAGVFQFGYVVDGCWEIPDVNPPQNVPEDFPVEANCPEPYRLSVSVDDAISVSGGIATCDIQVYDWQGTSTISTVSLECPDLFEGTKDAFLDQNFGTISFWMLQFENELDAPEGFYPALVRVDDVNEDPLLGPVSAYWITSVEVNPPPPPPDDIYVDRDWPGTDGGYPELGTPEAPFNTINEGILVAEGGAMVRIDPSNEPYNEQVSLKDNRYIIGHNWRDDGDSGQPVIEAMEFVESIYGVAVSNVTIDNLEVRPGGDLMEEFLYGIYLDYYDPYEHQENVTVKNCTFTGDRVHTGNNTGDEVICCEVNLTDNFIFEDNLITDCHVGSDEGGYFGALHIDVCDGVIVRRNIIKNCEFRNSFLGMRIWYSDEPVYVENNEVSYMVNSETPTGFVIGWAINVIGYSDVYVRNNVVHDLGAPGHRLETIGLFFRVSGDQTYYNWNIENNLIYNLYAQDSDNTYNSADCRGIMFRMNSYEPPNHLDGLRIANNTVANLTSGEYVMGMKFDIGSSNMLYNYEVENNIFYNIIGPESSDPYYDSGILNIYWPSGDLDVDYTLFYGNDIPDPEYVGVNLGPGCITGEDPMFDTAWTFPVESPAQLGNPDYIDWDDTGPASGDPGNDDVETRSRMGAYGGPYGDW